MLEHQRAEAISKTDTTQLDGLECGSGGASGHLAGTGKRVAAGDACWQGVQQKAGQVILEDFDCDDEHELLQKQQWGQVITSGWAGCQVYKHSSAVMWSGQQVTSRAYSKSKTRDGSNILVSYDQQQQDGSIIERPHIATVDCFLRIVHPELGTQRVAVTDMYF